MSIAFSAIWVYWFKVKSVMMVFGYSFRSAFSDAFIIGVLTKLLSLCKQPAPPLTTLSLLVMLFSFAASNPALAQNNDWSVDLSDLADPVPAGTEIGYELKIANSSLSPSPATTVEIQIPVDTEFTTITGSIGPCIPTPATGPATIICDVPAIPADSNIQSEFRVRGNSAGVIAVQATVPDDNDTQPANNTAIQTTTVQQGSDVNLTVNGPPSAVSGESVTLDFTVENLGPDILTSTIVRIPVPTGMNVTSLPGGCILSSGAYECTVSGPIAVGATKNLSVTGTVTSASNSTVTVIGNSNSSQPDDPNSGNDTTSHSLTVTAGSDLRIRKTRSPSGQILTGDTVTFRLQGFFTGDSPSGVTITDELPANYSVLGVTPPAGSDWTCNVAGQIVTCELPAGGSAGVNVSMGTIVIEAEAVSAGSIRNVAEITADGPIDPNPGNNTGTDGTAVIRDPYVDLAASKSGPTPPLVVVGNEYDYTIRARNAGTAPFWGTLVMTDNLPAGLTYNGLTTANGWTCTPGGPLVGPAPLTCTREYTEASPLNAGASAPSVVINTTVTNAGSINNSMTVSSVNPNLPDDNPANDTAVVPTTSSTGLDSADITIVKTLDTPELAVGDIQTFTLEIINPSDSTSNSIQVSDNVTQLLSNTRGAPNAAFISYTIEENAASGVTCGTFASGGRSVRLTCNIASLPTCTPGVNCPKISFSVRPGHGSSPRANTASIVSNGTADPDHTNNTATSPTYIVNARADVTVTKQASRTSVPAGQELRYVITARNASPGLSPAQNVTVTDTLPGNMIFVSATPSAGSCSAAPAAGSTTGTGNDQVVCSLGAINSGAQRTVTVILRPKTSASGTSIENSVSVTTDTTELDSSNNSSSVTSEVTDSVLDLQISKDDSVDPVAIPDTTTYTLTVLNSGPSHAENVVVTDQMPAGNLSYVSHSVPVDGTCTTVPAAGSTGGTLTCSFPILEDGETREITIVAAGITKGVATNTATVSSDEVALGFELSALNNEVSETTTVRTRADVQIASKVADPGTVNLRDSFDFVITATNQPGPNLAEADDVVVSDTLPANMVLTGLPSVVATSGSITNSTCTGAIGSTSFSCDLGTLSSGGIAQVTAPVKVTAVTTDGQLITNTGRIRTSSLDVDASNDSGTGQVTVNTSSISGLMFRDFNDDANKAATDTAIAGATIALSGTAHDGTVVTRQVTTDTNGAFTFALLPEGEYTLTRTAPSEAWLNDGTNTPGDAGGTAVASDQITGVVLGGDTDATGYMFTVVPQARVGLAKSILTGPSANADGSFNVTFRVIAENFSLEDLTNITITDAIVGTAPDFGVYQALTTPASDTLTPGQYTVLQPPSGSCGGSNAAYTGDAVDLLAQGFDLASGATCTVEFALRVRPTVPLPDPLGHGGRYQNQASVMAEGVLSGQTSDGNTELTDLSDNGTNADASGNGSGRDANEDDPTPVAPVFNPGIALVKTADVSALSSPPKEGDEISYNFTITNTGDVNLYNVSVTDPLPGLTMSGTAIAELAPGASDSTTFTAVYVLTQADVDAGEVENQATVSAKDPYETDVNDLSGSANTNDTPLITPLVRAPSLTLVKTADETGLSSPAIAGEEIVYSFAIVNTGNVTLTNVRLEDPLVGLTLTGDPITSLDPGASDTTNFRATYPITQADIDAGQAANTATVFGTPPSGPEVSNISGTAPSNNTATITPLGQNPGITLLKEADDSAFLSAVAQVGDEIPYSFTITNTGNVTLTNVTIEDILPGVVLTNNPVASIDPGAVNTDITGTYALTQADVDRGLVNNTATVTGHYNTAGPNPQEVTDTSSDLAIVAPIEALPETFPPIETNGGTTTTVLASDTVINAQATLTNVTIEVLNSDAPLTLDTGTGLITLAPDTPAGAYQVSYEICSVAFPTVCDDTTETVTQAAITGLDVTKTQELTDEGDGIDGVGDLITYTITVKNIGNTPVENVTLTDDFLAMDGRSLTLDAGPDFDSADDGSAEGALEIGETATYKASFTFTIDAISGGGTSNAATATALPVFAPDVPGTPEAVSDLSDDGDDSDGNSDDDRTEYEIESSLAPSGLTVNKTTPRDVVERGSVVPYTITIRNDNPVVSGDLNALDILPAGFLYVDGSATLDGSEADVTVEGRVITWSDIPVPPLTTVTLTLRALVSTGSDPGEHVNTASIRNPSDDSLLAPPATATVRILPEPVFDCGDVIGRVFDDENGDGYQNDGEIGIPAARVAGVDGTVITTDEFGRFHVPCAMLPPSRGSNFILKLDTASLPTGYRLTSENPRVIRLTPGKMSEIHFGASLSRVVRVDLNVNAFTNGADGQPALKPQVISGISTLLQQIAAERVHLRLAFHIPSNADVDQLRQARALTQLTERHIRREWRDVGQVRLLIEHTIVRPH